MAEFRWAPLLPRLAAGAVVAALVVVGGRVFGLAFSPTPTVLLGLLAGAAAWFFHRFEEPPRRPGWQQPHPPAHAARFTADVTTRRLATMLAGAQPGSAFESGAVARTLAGLVERRLVRNHHLPADDPLAHAQDLLSPELSAYLATARDGRPRPLTRRALHAHLKEIEQL